jgi:hypothetical protein
MSLFQRLRNIEKKYAVSLLGFLLAIPLAVVAIYTDFLREQRPNLKYEILSNTPVLDIHEQVGNLSVLFHGQDIRQTGQSLYAITLRVVNDGRADILIGSYDDREPFGFAVPPTTIVERAEVLDASNDYLRRSVSVDVQPDSLVVFRKVIMERGESFTVKILMLQKGESEFPSLAPTGKVAGVNRIDITYPYRERNQVSFWGQTFSGGTVIQVVRLLSYSVILVILIVLFTFLGDRIVALKNKYRRKRLVREFKVLKPENKGDAFFQLFIKKGGSIIYKYESLLLSILSEHRVVFRPIHPRLDKELIDIGMLEKTGKHKYSVDKSMSEDLAEFAQFLREHGQFEQIESEYLEQTPVLLSDPYKPTYKHLIRGKVVISNNYDSPVDRPRPPKNKPPMDNSALNPS